MYQDPVIATLLDIFVYDNVPDIRKDTAYHDPVLTTLLDTFVYNTKNKEKEN
jgi:hypothetical protein